MAPLGPPGGDGQVLDAVNLSDRVVGTVRRADVFRLRTNFRTAHLFLFNPAGELLLQRLGRGRRRHPGRWGSSAAAYVSAGETYAEAIARRAREELGIRPRAPALLGKTAMRDGGCTKFVSVFRGRCNETLRVHPGHVAEVRFAAVPGVLRDLAVSPGRFTPTFARLAGLYLA